MNEPEIQEPGQLIRPRNLDEGTIKEVVLRIYGYTVTSYTELPSYDDRNYHVMVSQRCSRHCESRCLPDGYILKVLNPKDSKNLDYVDAMNSMLQFMNSKNVRVPAPQPSQDGRFYNVETFRHGSYEEECVVRLYDFIPGKILQKVPYIPELIYDVGRFVGKMDRALQDFHHPFYDSHDTVWSLANVPNLTDYLHVVTNDDDRRIVTEVIEAFKREVVTVYDQLQTGIIHGDANEQNILVKQVGDHFDVAAIIDVGDATKSYLIFELGILIAYVMIDSCDIDCLDIGGHILAGYMTELSASKLERDIVRTVAAARLVQSLVMGANAYCAEPGNEYLLTTSGRGWPCLRKLWACGKGELYDRWERIIAGYEQIDHV